jgi:hypothetical protein
MLDVIVAAALSVLPDRSELKPRSYATWHSTRTDDYFDAARALEYLKRERYAADESLLHRYGQPNQPPINLDNIASIAPWIESLGIPFVEYTSFAKIRKVPRYIGILTFTMPVISEAGEAAFVEVWTEDGRYSQMGMWWWIQLRFEEGTWTSDWRHVHAIS